LDSLDKIAYATYQAVEAISKNYNSIKAKQISTSN